MAESDGNNTDGLRTKLRKLCESSTLSTYVAPLKVPDNVIKFMRSLSDDSDRDPALQRTHNPYAFAKEKFNKIWRGQDAYQDAQPSSPVSKLTTMRGALTAYWTSERWAQAYMAGGATIGLATLTAANAVWMAEAYAGVMDSVAQLANPDADNVGQMIGDSLKTLSMYGGIQIGSSIGIFRLRGFIERDAAHWIKEQFHQAALNTPDMIQRLTHNTDKDSSAPDAMPDSPHERIGNAPTLMMQKFMNIAIGGWASLATSYFVGKAVLERSIPVDMLDNLGEKLVGFEPGQYGTAVTAATVIAAYLAVTTLPAVKISKKLKDSFENLGAKSGQYTESLVNIFKDGESIASSKSNREMHKALTSENAAFRDAEFQQDKTYSHYIAFMNTQGFVGHNIVSFLPAVAPLAFGGTIASATPVKTIFETHGLVSALMSSLSGVIEILPSFSEMSAAAQRLSGMARHFEIAADKQAFYSLSGTHEFKREQLSAADNNIVLQISDLELMKRGEDTAFMQASDITLNEGDWVHIRGPSGAGKSSFIKELADLWPYGRGIVGIRENASLFYAHQTPDISGSLSMAEHLLFGSDNNDPQTLTEEHRARMSGALTEAGLGQYADMLDVESIRGKPWGAVLSGGQKERLVLARIIYQQPDIIMLDEPTSDLDPQAKIEFFATLKKHCGQSTVLAITHDEHTPRDANDRSYFSKTLVIDKGQAVLHIGTDMADDDTDDEGVVPPADLIEDRQAAAQPHL